MRPWMFVVMCACSFPKLEPLDSDAPTAVIDAAVDAPDASPDAAGTAPSLIDQQIPIRIATLDTTSLQFTIQGTPSALIAWSITNGGGTFDHTTGTIATNAAGVGVLQLSYTAPSTPGDRAHVLVLGDSPSSTNPITTAVRSLVPVGESTPFASSGGQSISSSFLYAQRVHIGAASVVMKLALVVDNGGPNARLALYSDQAGSPNARIATTLAVTLVAGVNEIKLTAPAQVAAGDYWIAANFETQAWVGLGAPRAARQAYQALAFTAPLPTNVAMTVLDDKVVNFYAQLAN